MSDTQKPNTTLEKAKKQLPMLAGVQAQITRYVENGELTFPNDFNQANAMASAKVALIELGVIDANGNPTGTCTSTSLVNAVFDSMVQGMNVSKKQGYFINYGKKLTFQRSYFGDQALAERLKPGISVYCDVIYKGEKFQPAKKMTRHGLITVVKEHEMAWPRNEKEIVGCYCGSVLTNEETGEIEDLGIELMTMEQIRTSWKKSKSMGPTSFHNEQPDIACKRTVTRRWSKSIVNSSDDSLLTPLLKTAIKRQSDEAIEAEFKDAYDNEANSTPLSLNGADEPTEMPEAEHREETPTPATKPVQEPKRRVQAQPVAPVEEKPITLPAEEEAPYDPYSED